jgi:hypothetical protein
MVSNMRAIERVERPSAANNTIRARKTSRCSVVGARTRASSTARSSDVSPPQLRESSQLRITNQGSVKAGTSGIDRPHGTRTRRHGRWSALFAAHSVGLPRKLHAICANLAFFQLPFRSRAPSPPPFSSKNSASTESGAGAPHKGLPDAKRGAVPILSSRSPWRFCGGLWVRFRFALIAFCDISLAAIPELCDIT